MDLLTRRNMYAAGAWNGYVCFKVHRDRDGNPFPDGPKYVAFYHGRLVAERSRDRECEKAFIDGLLEDFRQENYKGLLVNTK